VADCTVENKLPLRFHELIIWYWLNSVRKWKNVYQLLFQSYNPFSEPGTMAFRVLFVAFATLTELLRSKLSHAITQHPMRNIIASI
jgi:hypothetical protein